MRGQKDKCENAPVESLASERLLSALCAKGGEEAKRWKYDNMWIE